MNTHKYKKPKIRVTEVKINFFFNNPRFVDALDSFNSVKLAIIGGCSGSCSCSGGCGCCFLPGTKILMADGSRREIENLKPQEIVVSFDLKENCFTKNEIEKVLTHHNIGGGYYIINRKLKVTGNHRVWTKNEEWQRIDQLQVGDQLLNQQGKWIKIKSMTKYSGINTVYNLHLKNVQHNYLAENVLVHNQDEMK